MIIKVNTVDNTCTTLQVAHIMLVQKISEDSEYGLRFILRDGVANSFMAKNKETRDADYKRTVEAMSKI